jgi:4-hydroxy-tetrahydrodipicolinate synthase
MPVGQLIIPPVTPFTEAGQPALNWFADYCAFLAERGAHALFVNGTTGEFPLLNESERRALAEASTEGAGTKAEIFVHVGAASTAEAVRLTLHAREIGAHAVAAVTPYYFAYTQDQILNYYRALVEAAEGFPVYAYTIPQRAGNDITPATYARLAGIGVVGIKDSSGDLNKIMAYLRAAPGTKVFAGADVLALALARIGGHGIVSGPSMMMPELSRAMLEAEGAGDSVLAERLHAIFWEAGDAVGGGGRIDLMRIGMEWRGVQVGPSRSALPGNDPEDRRRVYAALDALAAKAAAAGVELKPYSAA